MDRWRCVSLLFPHGNNGSDCSFKHCRELHSLVVEMLNQSGKEQSSRLSRYLIEGESLSSWASLGRHPRSNGILEA